MPDAQRSILQSLGPLFLVQFLSWSAMFCLWIYGVPVIAHDVFHAEAGSPQYGAALAAEFRSGVVGLRFDPAKLAIRSIAIEDGAATTITLHRQCCLFYRLPGQGYCGACPLAPEHRRATG